jgi:hypothetical protein
VIKYEISQQVNTVDKSWLEKIREHQFERIARAEFMRLIAENPKDYFELTKVETVQQTMAFTPWRGKSQ